LRSLNFIGMLWERIFVSSWLCVHVMDGTEIIWYMPRAWLLGVCCVLVGLNDSMY